MRSEMRLARRPQAFLHNRMSASLASESVLHMPFTVDNHAVMGTSTADSTASNRFRKQPERFEPAEFASRPLPDVAERQGSQKARARELALEREQHLACERRSAYEEGLAEAASKAEIVVKSIKNRMDELWTQLTDLRKRHEKEKKEAADLWRKTESEKRQKTLEHFFANPLQHVARPRKEPESLGQGYTERNIASGSFAQHVKAVELQIITLAKDDPLKQLQLAAAVSQRMQGIRTLRERDLEAWNYVRNSLKAFFSTLRDRYEGRFPNHVRAAQQAVCAAVANAVPTRKLHVVSAELGVSIERLSEGRKHWTEWVSGDRESIADLRGNMRSDGMDDKWIEFAIDVWKTSTRRSERAKDSVRNPNDKSDKQLYRIHWLEVRIRDIHEHIVREGKRKFDVPAVETTPATEGSPAVEAKPAVEFHFSWWYTTKVRPFFVKDGGREVCVCVYHLRFDLLVQALYNYVKRLRQDIKMCTCQHANHKSPIDFRRAYVCQRNEGERFDAIACATNICDRCADLKMFKVCDCTSVEALPKIKCQVYERISYECKDGTIKDKKDFVPRELPWTEFEKGLRKYWPKFMLHHDVGKWQDDECSWLKTHVPRGETFEIEDFGENYHIERKREHQSYYFCEVGVTLHGCMQRVRVEDLSDDYLGGAGERARLMELFAREQKLAIVLIAHIVISEDLAHDNAFVQHVNSNITWPWLKRVLAPGTIIRRRTLCTDGAPQQYKLADQILWISKQGSDIDNFISGCATSAANISAEQPTPHVRHVFRGTAHGKDDSDPELGHHKNAADRWQLRAAEGEVARIFTPRDFYEFASTQMRELQKDFYTRKGVGIFRREFHWVPNRGIGSVNRRIPGCNRIGDVGIKKLHFFESVGRPGFVGIRERSCSQCPACVDGRFEACENWERCGKYRILELSPKTAIPRPSTRCHRENGALAFAESAKEGAFFAVDRTNDSMEKFTLFSVAKDSMLRVADQPIKADNVSHLDVRKNEEVIDGVRYSCVSPGGTVFARTGVEVVVPIASIFAFNCDVEELDTSRRTFRSHIHMRKWQLSSDEHSRLLHLLSETLDDIVQDAVQNVSGRS